MRLDPRLPLVTLLVLAPCVANAAPPARPVRVVNFPNPQPVSGSVEISNLPAVQEVVITNDSLPVVCQPGPQVRFLGLTQATTTGGFGRFAMNGLCAAEFGSGARMCEWEEVQGVTPQPAGEGWLNEAPVVRYGNCDFWTTNTTQGLGATMSFNRMVQGREVSGTLAAFCSTALSVSCCGP